MLEKGRAAGRCVSGSDSTSNRFALTHARDLSLASVASCCPMPRSVSSHMRRQRSVGSSCSNRACLRDPRFGPPSHNHLHESAVQRLGGRCARGRCGRAGHVLYVPTLLATHHVEIGATILGPTEFVKFRTRLTPPFGCAGSQPTAPCAANVRADCRGARGKFGRSKRSPHVWSARPDSDGCEDALAVHFKIS